MEELASNGRIFGIGVDLVDVNRFKDKTDNIKFLQRVFTENELSDAGEGPHKVERLAARWAAKEAVGKALGCGIGTKVGFKQVEVLREAQGKPYINLTGKLPEAYKNLDIFLSLSHDAGMSIAFVVIYRR